MSEVIEKYKEFIIFLDDNVSDEKKLRLTNLKELSEEEINKKLEEYIELINEDKKYQNYLLNENKKLFMNNNNFLLDFCLKNWYKRFNNKTKNGLWEFLQIIFILANKNESTVDLNIKLLNKLEKLNNEDSDSEDELELNLADKMIRDIAESFNGNNKLTKDNAINNIIETSQKIGEKYKNDLKNGKLNFMDVINSFQKMTENMEEEEGDEEFDSTMTMPSPDELIDSLMPNSEESEKMKSMFKNMESMLSSGSNPLEAVTSMLGMGKQDKKEAEPLTEEQLLELEKYYKEQGINLDELKKN
jgi:hypothetical protein